MTDTNVHLRRNPYDVPQTGMERAVDRLVTMLRHEEHTRGEFAQAIEATMSYAFALETACHDLRRKLDAAERAYATDFPAFVSSWSEDNVSEIVPLRTIDWDIRSFKWRYRSSLHEHQSQTNWERVRKATWRQLFTMIKAEFNRTFPRFAP